MVILLIITRSDPKVARHILLEHLKQLPKGTSFKASTLATELEIPGYLVKETLHSFLEEGVISNLKQL